MTICSVCENLQIVPGRLDDYRRLARYHYLGSRIGPASAIFVLRKAGCKTPVGVIVYSNAPAVLELRNFATGRVFAGLDKNMQLELINANIRRISRVIISHGFAASAWRTGLSARRCRRSMYPSSRHWL